MLHNIFNVSVKKHLLNLIIIYQNEISSCDLITIHFIKIIINEVKLINSNDSIYEFLELLKSF